MSRLRLPGTASSGRPNVDLLLDGAMRVHRPTETKGTMRETIRTYPVVYQSVACTLNRKATALQVQQGGLVPAGSRKVYCGTGIVLLERDVLEITAGPDAGAKLEVEAVAVPRGHHIEATCSEFNGKLP